MHHNSLSAQYVDTHRHSHLVMKVALRLELALASSVVGCSEGVIADLAVLARVPSRRFQAIPNPVKIRTDIDSGAVAAADEMWGVPRGRRILAVGNLKPQKNYPLLFEAYAAMKKGDADRLIVIGDGDLRDALERQARDLRIDRWVRMPGQSECLEAYYKTAGLFVMSSRHEGLPTVLIEALGFGLPVVATDCPSGPREILDGGQFGTLVPMGDPAALAKAMEEALARPADKAALTSRANDFAPDAISRRLLGLLADSTIA
jgi:glycosyltransferase involved in cell wall biosynthesis